MWLYFECIIIITILFIASDAYVPDLSYAENIQIVHPRIYDATVRKRRDIYSNIYFEERSNLKMIEIGDWAVELNSGDNLLVTPGLQAEWVSGNGMTSLKGLQQCHYKLGVVRGIKSLSKAAVTMCGRQITGYIDIGGLAYFLQPLNESNGAHILYTSKNLYSRIKRSSDYAEFHNNPHNHDFWLFNLTGDTLDVVDNETDIHRHDFDDEGDENHNDEERELDSLEDDIFANATYQSYQEWRREQVNTDEIGYFYDTAWTANKMTTRKHSKSVLPARWLEIAIAVDYTLITFHGKEKLEQYVLALMNIVSESKAVSAIYQDVSLEANMKLVITRLLLYEHKKQAVVRPGNAKKSLENVNNWNNRLHMSLAPGEPRHDIAVWITKSDIGGPSGYAPVSGACDQKRSCALNRDEGLTSSFIIAHEMAHILGLSHDGDKKANNHCGPEALEGSVMAPMVAATFNKFFWSYCSRKEFRKHVKKWSCLSNSPVGLSEIVLNATLQNAFSMDEQCRMEFGEGYTLCRAFDIVEPCSHLWCGHMKSPLVCRTKKGPPLEGTECGFDKWCVNGYCEEINRHSLGRVPVVFNPQDGGWSKWSTWGTCSRTCDNGVQFRTRKCNNPLPLYGGKNCDGEIEDWRICNKNICPEPFKDIRAQQCKRLPKLLNLHGKREGNFTWLPYESDQSELKCKLICISEESKELFVTSENLLDGTPCSYENSDNICVQGVCQNLGCDGQLYSHNKTDACGICGGNNSDCSTIKSVINRRLRREISRAVVLPRMSREIKVEANVTMQHSDDPAVAFILKNRSKKKYSMTIPNAGVHTQIIEGTKFYYRKTLNRHNIWAKGPVLAEMLILLYAPISEVDAGINITLQSEYNINKEALIPSKKFAWILGGWGPCSASCGGGRRQRTAACWDIQNSKLVRRKHCSLVSKPLLEFEKCNTFGCNFQWIAGDWEPCSATCGLNGIQYRELYCLPQAIYNGSKIKNPWKYMVSPNKCSGMAPSSFRSCNKEPCLSYWTFGNWSTCSASCGTGISTRSSFCPPPENESFYSCGDAPLPYQRRVCHGQYTRHTNALCKGHKRKPCMGDQSKYCYLNILSKYCKVGGFRRLCCKSCSNFHLTPVSV